MTKKGDLVENYRKAYVAIKLYPFIYTAVLMFLCPFELFLSLQWAELLALFLFTSLPSVCLLLRLSNVVKLCPCHRAQCVIMLLPLAIPLCRIFWPGCVILVWGAISLLLIASLVNAYVVFIKPSALK